MIKFNKLFLPCLIVFIIINFNSSVLISFVFILLHEITHYLVARSLGFSGYTIEIYPFGTAIYLKELQDATPKEDIIISIIGPLFNLILAFCFYNIYIYSNKLIFNELFKINLTLGIFNFMPAIPLDGGRIIRALITLKTVYRRANEISIFISFIFGYLFLFLFLLGFLNNKLNLFIGIIAFIIILNTERERRDVSYVVMRDVLRKKDKFIKSGYLENKMISVYFKIDLLKTLSLSDKNKYTVFTVLDDKMKMIDLICEEEILEGLKKFGNITLEEYCNEKDINY